MWELSFLFQWTAAHLSPSHTIGRNTMGVQASLLTLIERHIQERRIWKDEKKIHPDSTIFNVKTLSLPSQQDIINKATFQNNEIETTFPVYKTAGQNWKRLEDNRGVEKQFSEAHHPPEADMFITMVWFVEKKII